MNENLNKKRLLLLGGSQWKEEIKKFAEENNITLIATGSDSTAGIFEIANEVYNIDSTNIEKMKKLIKEKKIDGVYMGGSETVIQSASQYINELNLPCYCTNKQWNFFQNKLNFKKICIKYNLPIVPKYEISNINDIDNTLEIIEYPVVTKPVDGCGSSGFSVCHNYDELKEGYSVAKLSSPTESVIVEKFVNNSGLVVFYQFTNGKMIFCGSEDKFPVKYDKHSSYVVGMIIFKSILEEKFRLLYEKKIELMFNDLNMKEGTLWIEVFYDNNNFYFNESGYRYGGTLSIFPIDYYYNINQVAVDINYALTGESKIYGFNSLLSKKVEKAKKYCVYCIHLEPGKISKMSGIDVLTQQESIVLCRATKNIGDIVPDNGTFYQVGILIHFIYENKSDLENTIEQIHNTLVVIDDNGNNMINKMIDLNKIYCKGENN